ncbi:MAG: signal recognition particle protein [Acidimicrobiia bacterium]
MFDALSARFDDIFTRLRGRGRLSERDIDEVAREIRIALLEADVNVKVVKSFIARVKERAAGEDVLRSLTPAQQVIKIVNDELVTTLGGTSARLDMGSTPVVILLAGLQGSGKTTTAAKLAAYLESGGRKAQLVAADLQRPAAVEQLTVLGGRIGVPVYSATTDAVSVAREGVAEANRTGRGVVLVDTAGRLQIDTDLMTELQEVRDAIEPRSLLVVDAMTGQQAVDVAAEFEETLGLDGVILTKLDGDARGGAALSVAEVVGKPILFVSTGEQLGDFDVFHPDRMASRILGMGDVLTLIEKAEATFDREQTEAAEKKLRAGDFTLDDFLDQMRQVRKLGPISNLVGMLPGLPKEVRQADLDEGELTKVEAIICSMTPAERRDPSMVNGSRRLRIARGSGTGTHDVNTLLKQFKMVRQLVRQAASGKRSRLPIPGL